MTRPVAFLRENKLSQALSKIALQALRYSWTLQSTENSSIYHQEGANPFGSGDDRTGMNGGARVSRAMSAGVVALALTFLQAGCGRGNTPESNLP
ncbi:MAG TPA: hypothetical protein VFA15_09110, partial [Nitrososphaera sp.]|nr:hypothetical protein [Nitrososphaera sp.]